MAFERGTERNRNRERERERESFHFIRYNMVHFFHINACFIILLMIHCDGNNGITYIQNFSNHLTNIYTKG